MTVPHLVTALTGPLLDLEQRILNAQPEIEHWLRNQWQTLTPPLYGSVDLRNAGFKLAPVDMNLFPGGFNNLNPEFHPLAVQAAMSALEDLCPHARRVLVIPENHTRNQFYLQNVAALVLILRQAGLSVRVGTLNPEISEAVTLALPDGQSLTLEPVERQGARLGLPGFSPCAILLNNDLSGGVPPVLQGLEQQVVPPLRAGWHQRRKTGHFAAYDRVADEFAALIGIDPWVINPYFDHVAELDFQSRAGEEQLAETVDAMLQRIQTKYTEQGINEAPYVIVKANAGTYGMGIMSVKSASEVVGLNRKQRNKMAVVKEGQPVHDVIVQEGVPTFESVSGAVAEPVVYMFDRFVIGGFYRVHTDRAADENLNAPGMHFVPLAFASPCSTPAYDRGPDSEPNRFYSYGVVARLSLLAAAYELLPVAQPALAV